jgi:hypothetical protein
MEVVNVSSTAHYRSACRENTLVVVTLEFLYRRSNCILVYPPFDYENIRIDAMGYRKKRINALYTESADKQED